MLIKTLSNVKQNVIKFKMIAKKENSSILLHTQMG